MKQAKKQKQVVEVEEMVTQDGFVIAKVTREANQLLTAFTHYQENTAPHYDKIKALTKKLMTDFDTVSTTLFQLADSYKNLFDVTDNIIEEHQQRDFSKVNETYLRMSNVMTDWGNTMTDQIEKI